MTPVPTPPMSDRETEEAGLLAEIAEREAFEARFPPETFARIAEAMGLPPEPEILLGLRRSLLETFYFFYAISSGESLSREERISGLTELRDAARSLSKSLRYKSNKQRRGQTPTSAVAGLLYLQPGPGKRPGFCTSPRGKARMLDDLRAPEPDADDLGGPAQSTGTEFRSTAQAVLGSASALGGRRNLGRARAPVARCGARWCGRSRAQALCPARGFGARRRLPAGLQAGVLNCIATGRAFVSRTRRLGLFSASACAITGR
jgi:hypothetical protein